MATATKQTPILRREERFLGEDVYTSWKNERMFFCGDEIAHFFDIPREAEEIQFVASKKPNQDSLAVELCSESKFIYFTLPHESDWNGDMSEIVFGIRAAKFVYQKLGDKKQRWHISCYYWL